MMMNLLRDKSPNIQYEAFHVFKVGASLFISLGRRKGVCMLEQQSPKSRSLLLFPFFGVHYRWLILLSSCMEGTYRLPGFVLCCLGL